MTELEKKIEEKRHALYRAIARKKITDKAVVRISQQLDELLNEYGDKKRAAISSQY